MPYRGTKARKQSDETPRLFAVSAVILDASGYVAFVRWGEVTSKVHSKTPTHAETEMLSPVSDVVEAIHSGDQVVAVFPSRMLKMPDRAFKVVRLEDGRRVLALEGLAVFEGELADIAILERRGAFRAAPEPVTVDGG
jgi:hypothetical protein